LNQETPSSWKVSAFSSLLKKLMREQALCTSHRRLRHKLKMNKTDVLNTIQSAHASLEELLAPLNESQLCTPTLEGQLSIKDILVHLGAWERLCAGWIEALLCSETPDMPGEDEDTINERIFQENRNRPLHEVQE